jgi:hypothetical protein
MPSSDSSPDVLLEQLAAEFVERHRNGEHPSLSEYTDRHPNLAADIRELFPALVQIEKLKPAADATGAFEPTAAASDGTRLERLGDYRILREVGRGKVLADVRRMRQQPGAAAPPTVPPDGSIAHSLLTGQFAAPAADLPTGPVDRASAPPTSGLSVGGPEVDGSGNLC